MNLLQKLAIYILRKSNATVLINCKLIDPTRIKTKDNLWTFDNEFPAGTTFKFKSGVEHTYGKDNSFKLATEEVEHYEPS